MQDLEHDEAIAAPRQRLAPGTILGDRYELRRAVAAGGFGAVYEARHLRANRKVAIKVLHAWLADDPNTRERFRRELQAPAQIKHPGIVEVLDADVDPSGIPFLVMNWLEGETLRQRFDQGPLSLTELRDVFDPFLDALDAAHTAGFIHRDLKPENCMLIRDPDGVERPRIVDFGLARKTGARSVTVTGTALGTPRYMSPEQFMNAKEVGPESDVWAVGAMMYEALVGEPPFSAQRSHALMLQILTEDHPPITSHLPHLPPRLAALIEHCLDKNPEARPPDAHALRSRFLGAFAAISGGLALRTIPEMPKTDAASLATAPAGVSSMNHPSTAVTRDAPPSPRAPASPPLTPAHTFAPRPAASPLRGLLWLAGGFAGLGLLAALAVGAYVVVGSSRDDETTRSPTPPRPTSVLVPAPMEPIADPVASPPDDTPGLRPAAPVPDPEPAETDDNPLSPLTGPLDRLLFE